MTAASRAAAMEIASKLYGDVDPNERDGHRLIRTVRWLNKKVDEFIHDTEAAIDSSEMLFEYEVPRHIMRYYDKDETRASRELTEILLGILNVRGISTDGLVATVTGSLGRKHGLSVQFS